MFLHLEVTFWSRDKQIWNMGLYFLPAKYKKSKSFDLSFLQKNLPTMYFWYL